MAQSTPKSIIQAPKDYPARNSGEAFDSFLLTEPVPLGYNPVEYTSGGVIAKSGTSVNSDPMDPRQVVRSFSSFHGNVKINSLGRPLNPFFRTGITGRGRLYKWGANYAADAIVTRYNEQTEKLEVLLIQRSDNGEWAFPGGFVNEGEAASVATLRELHEEAGVDLQSISGVTIYRGYVDDPRSTDNAWIETTAVHYRLGNTLEVSNLKAGDDAVAAKWVEINGNLINNMYASHGLILQAIVD